MKSSGLIVLAAGGTGGHLFPAYALAEELARRGFSVELMTDMRGDKYGVNFPARAIHPLPSATLKSWSPVDIARTGLTLLKGFWKSLQLIKKSRPSAMIGFGGYPSFMPLIAANLSGVPTAIHEQNAILGRANRFLASRVNFIATSFEQTKLLKEDWHAKVRYTGNPTRDVVKKASQVNYSQYKKGEIFNLLIFGGSQGAKYFSDIVPPALEGLPGTLQKSLNIVQQARPEDLDRLKNVYNRMGLKADVQTFFNDLPTRIAASHLVLARSGASTVAELCVIGRPSLLVPLPHSLDNDQLQNALRLAESGGAWCMEQMSLTAELLTKEISRLMLDGALLSNAARCAKNRGMPEAVNNLTDLVEEMVR